MVLIDTSVWIDFFANRPTPQVEHLVNYIQTKEDLCICGVILTEILQGIKKEKQYNEVVEILSSILFLEMSRDTFVLSAEIYHILRIKGITIRKTIDCMIAAVAIENHLPLLHNDIDFKHIAKHTKLKIIK